MKLRKKIGIQYCGGCNPTYERVELIERIQSRLGNQFLFVRHDSPRLDALVLVNGCPRSCATKEIRHKQIPHHSAVGEGDFEGMIDWLTILKRE